MARRRSKQIELNFKTWGGRREGAGRPQIHDGGAAHRRRPTLTHRIPVQVTLSLRGRRQFLRSRPCFKAIARAINDAKGRFETTIAHFTVQSNHMHLIVESVDERKLAAAMKGLSVRIAKALNRAAGKQGQVIDSRYHTRYLRTPTEVKHAVRYVLRNHTKHSGARGIDPYASLAHPELVTPARTWLLNHPAPS